MNPFLFRRIRGPVFLLTFATTALLHQWHVLSFGRSWPLYLIVAGLLRLLESVLPVTLPAGYNPSALPYRRSLTGGIVVLLLGIAALLVTTGSLDAGHFFGLFSRWWPLLLILIGIFLLIERLFDRGAAQRYAASGYKLPPRRGGGVGFLVFIVIALGLTNPGAHLLPHEPLHWGESNFGFDWGDNPFNGETHENAVTLSEAIPARGSLNIDNARGDVSLAPSTDGRIHVRAVQSAHVSDDEKDRAFEHTRPTLVVHGDEAVLNIPSRPHVDVRLEITLPPTVAATVRTHHGDVSASGLQAALTVNSDHGDTTLDTLGGPVRLTLDHGDVRARSLSSDLLIEGRADDLSVTGIRGRTTLHGAFFGDTGIAEAGGPISFRSDRTTLEIPRLAGTLTLDGENLRVTDPSQGLELHTRSKGVEVTGLAGPATVEDANGDVSVGLAVVTGPVSVRNATGNITVSAPLGANFALSGETGREDRISSDFPFAQSSDGGQKTICGQQGQGGPRIELKTEHGDLAIRRAGQEKPERRLRAEGEVPRPVSE